MAKRWYYKDENGNKVPVPQYKINADDYYTKAMSDSRYYEKSTTDTLLSEKQNVLTAGNGITIADDVISVAEEKFTVWSNPRIDEYVTTFENFGYNDDGTQKTSGSSTRSWVFKIGNYGHKKVFFSAMNAWMCDGLDEAQNMINPTLLGKSEGNVDIGAEHIGKYIVAMSVSGYAGYGAHYGRCVQFCDDKTQSELDADERMLSDMYAGNLIRYAVSTSSIIDTPTLEWGDGAELRLGEKHKIFLDSFSRPNIGYECKVVKNLNFIYQGCGRLREITPLWDTSLVTTMLGAFNTCLSLERTDLSHLDLSSVTDVSFMFNNCKSLQSATIPSLPAVTRCDYIFNNCSSLQSVTLPSLQSVTNCTYMFKDCTSLQNVTCLGELPKCAISFGWSSKLTLESITNIITHLPDLSAEDSKTLTLHATTKALLTEALIAEATNKNWIIA